MFKIENGMVFKISETFGGSIITELIGLEKQVKLITDKTMIKADGIDMATITATWQKFDIDNSIYVDDIQNNDQIQVDVAGSADILTPVNGVVTFNFKSNQTGQYAIYSLGGQVVINCV